MTTKKQLSKELKQLSDRYIDDHDESSSWITKVYYLRNTTYGDDFLYYFNSFNAFKQEIFPSKRAKRKAEKEEIIGKDHFSDRIFDDSTEEGIRGYVVTAIIEGAPLNTPLFNSMVHYCDVNNYKLVLLPMRGVVVKSKGFSDVVMGACVDYFAAEYVFNGNLKAMDFTLQPQMTNPLTSLDRYGQKNTSLIVAHPKQQMEIVATTNDSNVPHIMHATGTASVPIYRNTRQGTLSEQDQVKGGLIVEIEDDEVFHIREFQADRRGAFYDFNEYYRNDTITIMRAEAFIMGDFHSGSQCLKTVAAWKECLKLTNPKRLFWHDVFDGTSINHHTEKNIVARVAIPEHINTLYKELTLLGKELEVWSKEFPDIEHLIVKSNHDEWLSQYLQYGKYIEDAPNHRLSLDLAASLIDGKDPLGEYLKTNFKIPNFRFLKRDESYKVEGIECGVHGDKGNNGARGSKHGHEKAHGRCITGHTHTPSIFRNTWSVGTTTKLRLGYNQGPSTWLNSSALIFKGGQRTLVNAINGKWTTKT